MLLATALPRNFEAKIKNQVIPLNDPDPNMSPESVLNFYSNTYPELITAKISSPIIENDKLQYKFESVMGTKG